MKTKEIDCWISARHIDMDWVQIPVYKDGGSRDIKAKLLIEIPERKVEITESQFDQAVTKHKHRYSSARGFWDELKKELGLIDD